jgi:hypothetical protein
MYYLRYQKLSCESLIKNELRKHRNFFMHSSGYHTYETSINTCTIIYVGSSLFILLVQFGHAEPGQYCLRPSPSGRPGGRPPAGLARCYA